MKTLKIIAVITLVVVVAAMLTATTYAYTGGRIGTSVSANSGSTGTAFRGYGGMMSSNGMMRSYDYSSPVGTVPKQPSAPSTKTPPGQTNQYPIGGGGCLGMRRILG